MWKAKYDARDEHSGTITNFYGEVIVSGLTMQQAFDIQKAHNDDLEAFQNAIYQAIRGVPTDPARIVKHLGVRHGSK